MYLIIIIGAVALCVFKLYHKLFTGKCKCVNQMHDKVVIITGSNTGMGFETALDLAKRGAKVILACRDEKKATTARDRIITLTGNQNVIFKSLDLASFKSVRKFAEDILNSETRVDVLINNAGTANMGSFLTGDGIPIEPQVNHFSPFLLTNLLLPILKASAPSRIINVSSIMHNVGKIDVNTFHIQQTQFVKKMRVYSNTKLANILFTRKLSEILAGTGVTVNCLHPGGVDTDMFRYYNIAVKMFVSLFFKTANEGAQTTIHLAVSKDLEKVSGKYFADCREKKTARHAKDNASAEALWKLSEKVVCWEKKIE